MTGGEVAMLDRDHDKDDDEHEGQRCTRCFDPARAGIVDSRLCSRPATSAIHDSSSVHGPPPRGPPSASSMLAEPGLRVSTRGAANRCRRCALVSRSYAISLL